MKNTSNFLFSYLNPNNLAELAQTVAIAMLVQARNIYATGAQI